MLQISGSVISAPEFRKSSFNKGYFRQKVWKYFCFHFIYFRRVMVSGSAEYWVVGNGAIMILSEYVLCILQLINLSPADARWETHYFSGNIAQRALDRRPSRFLGFHLSICHMYTFISIKTEGYNKKDHLHLLTRIQNFISQNCLKYNLKCNLCFAARLLHSHSSLPL